MADGALKGKVPMYQDESMTVPRNRQTDTMLGTFIAEQLIFVHTMFLCNEFDDARVSVAR